MQQRPLQALIVDVFGTLSRGPNLRAINRMLAAEVGLTDPEATAIRNGMPTAPIFAGSELTHNVYRDLIGSRCYNSVDALRGAVEKESGSKISNEAVARANRAIVHYQKHVRIDQASCQIVKRIKENGVKVCILSNCNSFDLPVIDRVRQLTGAHAMVTSCEVGHLKPAEEIFRAALIALDVEKASTLMVGDSFYSDCIGALAFGINVAWVNRSATKRETQLYSAIRRIRDGTIRQTIAAGVRYSLLSSPATESLAQNDLTAHQATLRRFRSTRQALLAVEGTLA